MSMKTLAGGALALALAASAGATVNNQPVSYEEALAHQEEQRVIAAPIAGIQNKFWFNYQVNLVEAKKELSGDLRHADRVKDQRNAWDEYRMNLVHERTHYVKVMAKRGYRTPVVTVVG